jgi:hypothetical protein
MGHPVTENATPFAFEPLYLLDEDARPVLVVVVKGTFEVGREGRCAAAEKQIPVNLGGEYWGEDGEKASIKYEPEVAFMKPATDVVMLGHAYAPTPRTTEMVVSLQVGPVRKHVQIFGERLFYRAAGKIGMTSPLAFEKMPLIYERAFGGWDRSHPDKTLHTCELRNPLGVGFRGKSKAFEEGLRLPNLEDPRVPLRNFGEAPPPAGFGFVAPHWQPRAALTGTYDEAWTKSRAPLLPKDFDRRHLNAASPGLIAPGYLRGDESVAAVGVKPDGQPFMFALPAVAPPVARVALTYGDARVVRTVLDTVIVEPDDDRVLLLWRACVTLKSGPHDVREIALSPGGGVRVVR